MCSELRTAIPSRAHPVAALVALIGLGATGLGGCDTRAPLPTLTQVEPFELVSDEGAPFGTAQLSGKVWVANFVFTTCPSVCPLLTTHMANLRAGLADTDVRFVSFSVDPETDTPEVLRAYRTRMDATGEGWTFLTGAHETVRQAIEGQMRVMMGERAGGDIPHSMHFILVDRTGHIRGFYNSSDREELARLTADARRLDDG